MKREEENFLRLLRIIIRDVPSKLRILLRTEFAKKYGRPYANDPVSGQVFLAKVRNKVSQAQIQNGNSEDFDCTTLFHCLLYSRAGLLPPTRPANTRVGPFFSSELVDQLREQRNLVAHSSKGDVTTLDFFRRVSELKAIYAQLGWTDTDLVKYAKASIDTAECLRLQKDLSAERTRNQGSMCRLWTCCVGLLSVVLLLIAVFLQWNGQLVEHDGRLQDHDRRLSEVQGGILDNAGHFEGLDHRVQGVEGQFVEHDGHLQDHDRRLGEVQRGILDNAGRFEGLDHRVQGVEGDVRDNKEHLEGLDHKVQGLEGLDHRVQGVEMTTKVLLGIGAIIAVLVIVTTVWWVCFQQKDRLKKVLKDRYRDMVLDMEGDAPLDEVYVELRLQQYDTENLPETLNYRDVIDMERRMQRSPVVLLPNLFDKMSDRVAPNKLLIRGKAGVGKTTLVRRIVSHWAAGNLWKDQFSYVFVVTLRELLQDKTWTLSELLLDGLPLSSSDKLVAFGEMCKHPKGVLCLVDGLDEIPYDHKSSHARDCNAPVDLSLMLSSIIGNSMLPGATILVTSRPNMQLPMRSFQRIVELYGFPRDSIYKYVSIFSAGNNHLEQFIRKNFEENPNITTYCYIPLQCQFVCQSLADVRSQSVDAPVIKTITQLYLNATINSAHKLHPGLKYSHADMDVEDALQVIADPFRKYADLAKHCVMTTPLRIIFYKGDLRRVGLREDNARDMQCGVMTQSRKRDANAPRTTTICWSFNHLTLQEYFSAIGLIQGSTDDIWQLLVDESSIHKHEVVISFLAGLLGDRRNTCYMNHLLSSEVSLDHRELVKKVAQVLKDDPLKVITILHETQDPELVVIVSSECKFHQVFPAEMRALSWVLRQAKCPVTNIDLSRCRLDAGLAKQLSDGLSKNTSIKSLDLSNCNLDADTVKELGVGMAANTSTQSLNLNYCSLSGEGSAALAFALGELSRLTELRLDCNQFDDPTNGQVLAASVSQMTGLHTLSLGYCHIPAESISELARGLHQLTALEDLNFSWNNFDVAAGAALGRSLSRLRGLEHLRLVGCHMNDNTAVHVAECVAYSPGLQTFDLQMNHISRPGVERVKEIIGGRGRLVELDYQEPPSDEDCGRLCDGGLWQSV